MYVRAVMRRARKPETPSGKCWMAEGSSRKNSGITSRRSANYTQKRISSRVQVTKEERRSALLLRYVEGENTGGWAARRGTLVRKASCKKRRLDVRREEPP